MRRCPQSQRGVALIMVLFVVALVSVVALSLSKHLQPSVLRTATMQQAEQAYWYWLSAEEIARDLLQDELSDSDMVARRDQLWAEQASDAQAFPVEGGSITGVIEDLHSCFNLNALRGNTENEMAGSNNALDNNEGRLLRRKAQLRMLLLAVDERIDPYAADTVVDSLADWLDADESISGTYGAENADYESQQFPHQAANTFLTELSEFRLVRGVTPQIYQALEPYVCVWPNNPNFSLNVNTLSDQDAPLLHAVTLGTVDLNQAERFLTSRTLAGFDSDEGLKGASLFSDAAGRPLQANFGGGPRPTATALSKIGGALDDLSVKSEYFELYAKITFGDLTLRGRSTVRISKEQAQVLYRSLGD